MVGPGLERRPVIRLRNRRPERFNLVDQQADRRGALEIGAGQAGQRDRRAGEEGVADRLELCYRIKRRLREALARAALASPPSQSKKVCGQGRAAVGHPAIEQLQEGEVIFSVPFGANPSRAWVWAMKLSR